MYMTTIPNRFSPPAILWRESHRQGGKVHSRTLAHLTHWPPAQLAALRRGRRGDPLGAPAGALEIVRRMTNWFRSTASLVTWSPYGHDVSTYASAASTWGSQNVIAMAENTHRAPCRAHQHITPTCAAPRRHVQRWVRPAPRAVRPASRCSARRAARDPGRR